MPEVWLMQGSSQLQLQLGQTQKMHKHSDTMVAAKVQFNEATRPLAT